MFRIMALFFLAAAPFCYSFSTQQRASLDPRVSLMSVTTTSSPSLLTGSMLWRGHKKRTQHWMTPSTSNKEEAKSFLRQLQSAGESFTSAFASAFPYLAGLVVTWFMAKFIQTSIFNAEGFVALTTTIRKTPTVLSSTVAASAGVGSIFMLILMRIQERGEKKVSSRNKIDREDLTMAREALWRREDRVREALWREEDKLELRLAKWLPDVEELSKLEKRIAALQKDYDEVVAAIKAIEDAAKKTA